VSSTDYSINVFFNLLRAGLWENSWTFSFEGLEPIESVDWEEVYRLASEQSVLGLVLAGIETLSNEQRPPKQALLQWIGEVQMLEQQNKEMNDFIAVLVDRMRKAGVYALLVKGQGIAQCYERPLWRSCGDVDLLLDRENYEKAKLFLIPLAGQVDEEDRDILHQGMKLDQWSVELHGTMLMGITGRINRVLGETQLAIFNGGGVRSWQNGKVPVYLPSPDNDIILVFAHILMHFFIGGVGLRQICDWCRLLYTFKDSLNYGLLESRIRRMGLMSEWKAFYALATKYLGMPEVPCFMFQDSGDPQWERKADRIMEFILKSGNMGHNRDMSHFSKYPYLIRKCVSMGRRIGDLINHARIFPLDSLRFFPRIMFNGVRSAMRGE
jgi:hypothetical protein